MANLLFIVAVLTVLASPCIAATVHVDDFLGTSTFDAINSAALAAGPGGEVLFRSGATYELDRFVTLDGQTWRTDGDKKAIIRRSDAVEAFVSQPVLDGATSISVTDSSVFLPGMEISPLLPNGKGGREDSVRLLTQIVSIEGDVIHLNRPIRAFPQGSKIVSAGRLVVVRGDSNVIQNLSIDGNREGNADFTNWAIFIDIHLGVQSTNTIVENVEVFESPGNSSYDQGRDNIIRNSSLTNANCAALHLSNSRSLSFIGNYVSNTNELAEKCQHSTGAIEWSLANTATMIHDNVFESIPAWALGIQSIDRTDYPNYGMDVRRNRFEGNDGVFQVTKLTASEEDKTLDLVFRENVIVASGDSIIMGDGPTSIRGIEIANNDFLDSRLIVIGGADSTIYGNRFSDPDGVAFERMGENFEEFDNEIVRPADVNWDGNVTIDDIDALRDAIRNGSTNPQFDVDRSGIVSEPDIDALLIAIGTVRGDANLDGRVDAVDLNTVGVNWNQNTATWSSGDFNGDYFVDAADLNKVGLAWLGGHPPPASVPESSGPLFNVLWITAFVCAHRTFQRAL